MITLRRCHECFKVYEYDDSKPGRPPFYCSDKCRDSIKLARSMASRQTINEGMERGWRFHKKKHGLKDWTDHSDFKK